MFCSDQLTTSVKISEYFTKLSENFMIKFTNEPVKLENTTQADHTLKAHTINPLMTGIR